MSSPFPRSNDLLTRDRRRGWGLFLVAVVTVLGAWLVWALRARVDVLAVSDEGWLETRNRPFRIEAPVPGVVTELQVTLGEPVEAGQPLVVLERDVERLSRDEVETRKMPLRTRVESVDEQLAAVEGRREALDRASRAALAGMDARLTQARAERDRAEAEAERARRLTADGVSSSADLEASEAVRGVAEAEVSALEREIERERWRARSEEASLLAEEAELRSRAETLRGSMAELDLSLERLDREIARRVIRSPARGTVGALAVRSPGIRLDEGDPVATIVPDGALGARAFFGTADAVGRIRPGQPSRIAVDGLPWIQLGTVAAKVERVASEPTADGHGVEVELVLDPTVAQGARLVHGMSGEVRVVVERLSPAALLLRALGERLEGDGADD